ncbi:MAG: hypothetical protein LBS60_13280 [Deltaproteobacteria bacterium]|nr:hypothetical protein [Deltaproteobacteria bacterium]
MPVSVSSVGSKKVCSKEFNISLDTLKSIAKGKKHEFVMCDGVSVMKFQKKYNSAKKISKLEIKCLNIYNALYIFLTLYIN